MNTHDRKTVRRRQVLQGGLRSVAGGLLALGAGSAVLKRRRLLREGKCLNRGVCGQCQLIEDCGLPRALSVKQALRRKTHGR